MAEPLVEDALLEPPARAPPDEPATSADEESEAEETSLMLPAADMRPGAWVALHSLSRGELNGAIGVLIERSAGAQGEQRWNVLLLPQGENKKLKPENLAVVAPHTWGGRADATEQRERTEAVVRHVLDAFLETDAEQLVFPAVLSSEARSRVHGLANEPPRDDQLSTQSCGSSNNGTRYITVIRVARQEQKIEATAANDLAELRFDKLCELLELLEAVPDYDSIGGVIKGAAEKRKQLATRFWSLPLLAPRHACRGVFGVLRLLMPFHDLRRYGVSQEHLARWAAQAVGLGSERANAFAKEWMFQAGSESGDLSMVLRALFEERVGGRLGRPLTVGDVNMALNALQNGGKQQTWAALLRRAAPREVLWLVRIVQRDVRIGCRPSQPVPQKGEYPKIVMDGFCRAQGRLGTPKAGNPPRMYSLLRYQNNLQHVCNVAERRALPHAYPPPLRLMTHVRAQLSTAPRSLDEAASSLGTSDVFIETKYDGFRFQMHWDRKEGGAFRAFYRSGVECTDDVADLLPAVRLALGAAQPLEGERFTWLRHAWGAVPAGTAARVAADVETLILDGELLVYQETETSAGQYDELGSKPGIQAFGTIHWLRQSNGGPSNYGRSDARRHLMVKVYDVLFLNGVQTMEWPLSERRKLLESGRCFVPIPHYLELSAAQRVDLGAPSRPLHVAFDDARSAGEEGLMVKAAHQPYVPNARNHVLKCKVEFIEGLGDTVTLLLLGARAPRRLGTGGGAHRIAEFVLGAKGEDGGVTWLCNSSPLSWHDSLPQVQLEALWLRLTEDQPGRPALMRRLPVDDAPPAWLGACPTTANTRPHWVLRSAATAPVVGSRFLRSYKQDMSSDSNKDLAWKLRFPRITKWAEASAAVEPDTVASFTNKALVAFAHTAAEGGVSVAERARAASAPPQQSWPPQLMAARRAADEDKGTKRPRPSWTEATRLRAMETAAAAASNRAPKKRVLPPPGQDDWATGESADNM